MIDKKVLLPISYILFYLAAAAVYHEVEAALRLVLLFAWSSLLLIGFFLYREDESVAGRFNMILSGFLIVITGGVLQAFVARLSGLGIDLFFALAAATLLLQIIETITPHLIFQTLLVLCYASLLLFWSLAEFASYIVLIFVFLPVLLCRFKKLTVSVKTLIFLGVFWILLATPLISLLNMLTVMEEVTLTSSGFAVVEDHLLGTAILPLVDQFKEEWPTSVQKTITCQIDTKKQTLGRRYFFSRGLPGTIRPVEIAEEQFVSIFVPDVLLIYPGQKVLPWGRRDCLTITLARGLFGQWRVSQRKLSGRLFNFRKDWFHASGKLRYFASGDSSIHLLEEKVTEEGVVHWLTGFSLEGIAQYTAALSFEALGLVWQNGPVIFGAIEDEMTLEKQFVLEFRDSAGQLKTGIAASGMIHAVIPVAKNSIVLFHGRTIELMNDRGNSLLWQEREGSGPVIALWDSAEKIYYLDYLESRLYAWSLVDGTIEDLGKNTGEFMAITGKLLVVGNFKENSLYQVVGKERIKLPGLYKNLRFLASLNQGIMVGYGKNQCRLITELEYANNFFTYPFAIPPQATNQGFVTTDHYKLHLLDETFKSIKTLMGVTYKEKADK